MTILKRLQHLEHLVAVRTAMSIAVFHRLIIGGEPFHRYALGIGAVPEVGLPEVRARPGESNLELIERASQLIRWPEPEPGQREVRVAINLRTTEDDPCIVEAD